MSQSSLVSEWINRFTDPFAVLGVAVTADDRRVQKRYRTAAKHLHPDRFIDADEVTKELTIKLLSRLVNPAYEKLRNEKDRKENLALLRLKVRRLTQKGPLSPKSTIARQLMERPVSNVDVFYEQAIAQLSETQFDPHQNFAAVTEQIAELNLVYLQLKMGDTGVVQEKRTGLIAVGQAQPIQFTPVPANPEVAAESYDRRHYRRAQEYAKKGAWSQVVQELRDAIKIRADKSQYHSLLGVAYLNLEKPLPGMAKVHLKRALELNPQDACGLKFGPKVGLVVPKTASHQSTSAHTNNGKSNGKQATNATKVSSQPPARWGGLFGLFGRR